MVSVNKKNAIYWYFVWLSSIYRV